jgi:hypothetical protein
MPLLEKGDIPRNLHDSLLEFIFPIALAIDKVGPSDTNRGRTSGP